MPILVEHGGFHGIFRFSTPKWWLGLSTQIVGFKAFKMLRISVSVGLVIGSWKLGRAPEGLQTRTVLSEGFYGLV